MTVEIADELLARAREVANAGGRRYAFWSRRDCGLSWLGESSQSRVAKAEAADETVSLDLLIRSLLALGATDRNLAEVITGKLAKAS